MAKNYYTYDHFELDKVSNDEWLVKVPSLEVDFSQLTKMNIHEKNFLNCFAYHFFFFFFFFILLVCTNENQYSNITILF